ncbi:MAG: low molecular weight phosphatase family protein [Oscillatoriales cyanobacterium RM1_1_9]|nr:low molecular weight phosphatase family protein [Oscillatoriales cyanobacterium SM2_3_0]NJO48034.1 low molecular weight phosphatase family protein [Oscillatoriales cyanobacterium RM2_1_1]NJO72132.1 low molecular weight phosphatase family protein [Oscillatoriales cyanobacterium RM1_1_9]
MKKVLFLCTGNYYRSRFAEYLFNHWAIQSRLKWRAESRGLAVDQPNNNLGAIAPQTIRGLEERGIKIRDYIRHPLQVSEVDFKAANKVIAVEQAVHRSMMMSRYPGWVDSIEYWNVQDLDQNSSSSFDLDPVNPINSEESPLDQLEQKIRPLFAALEANQRLELSIETQSLLLID